MTRELVIIPKNLFVNCFTRLAFLNMSNYGVKEIARNHFKGAKHLIKLDLSRNQLSILPSNVFELAPNIEIIDLSCNQIGTDGIDEYTFETCTSLKQLDLSNNRIGKIGENWLAPLKSLQVLNLNDNSDENGQKFQFKISDYSNNFELVSLYAKNSDFKCSNGIDLGERFTYLLRKLKKIYIAKCIEDGSSRTNLKKYNSADIMDTDLAIIEISGIGHNTCHGPLYLNKLLGSNFKIVIANQNNLGSILLSATIPGIVELYLSHNRLREIDFVEYLPNLEIADFSSNKIRTIDEDFFESLVNLRELNLAYNRLQGLDLTVMEQIPKLKIFHNAVAGLFKSNLNTSIELINIADSEYAAIDV